MENEIIKDFGHVRLIKVKDPTGSKWDPPDICLEFPDGKREYIHCDSMCMDCPEDLTWERHIGGIALRFFELGQSAPRPNTVSTVVLPTNPEDEARVEDLIRKRRKQKPEPLE